MEAGVAAPLDLPGFHGGLERVAMSPASVLASLQGAAARGRHGRLAFGDDFPAVEVCVDGALCSAPFGEERPRGADGSGVAAEIGKSDKRVARKLPEHFHRVDSLAIVLDGIFAADRGDR